MSLPAHNVELDTFRCFAMEFSGEIPYQKRVFEQVDIEDGLPRKYPSTWELRRVTFTAVIDGEYLEVRDELMKLVNKRVTFTSIYLGTFYCTVNYNMSIEDGVPGEQLVMFEIDEIADDDNLDGGIVQVPKVEEEK